MLHSLWCLMEQRFKNKFLIFISYHKIKSGLCLDYSRIVPILFYSAEYFLKTTFKQSLYPTWGLNSQPQDQECSTNWTCQASRHPPTQQDMFNISCLSKKKEILKKLLCVCFFNLNIYFRGGEHREREGENLKQVPCCSAQSLMWGLNSRT